MARRLGYVESRVGRRILTLFVLGAVLPIVLMAAASYNAMSTQIRRQSQERVRQISRTARQAIMQQLTLTESGVRLAAETVVEGGSPAREAIPHSISGISTTRRGEEVTSVLGERFAIPLLLDSERTHLARGDMVLKVRPGAPEPLMAVVALRPGVTRRGSQSLGREQGDLADVDGGGILWAVLEGDSIWGAAERFAAGGATRDFCVMVSQGPLVCRSPGAATVEAFLASGDSAPSGVLQASTEEGDVLIGHSELFLEAAFAAPPLRVLVSEGIGDLYGADATLFRYSFGVALVLGLLIMMLLAGVQIRRTMTPLEALTEGTLRLADGDLSARVDVASPDEFGFLAESFNRMAERLDAQVRTLEAGRAIDTAVLTAPDTDGVVTALLRGFDRLVACRSMAVLIIHRYSRYRAAIHWDGAKGRQQSTVNLSPHDREWLRAEGGHRVALRLDDRPPFMMEAIEAVGPSALTVLPLVAQGELLGAVLFEAMGDQGPDDETLGRARQVADQASAALDTVRLIGELEETNLGALRALARAIDAKSKWTAGHSERVTELSVELGKEVGLNESELEILQKGGLLHDVGKIGVPLEVLDSAHRPTPQEWKLIKEHPAIGVRILEPIRALEPMLPIVLQHHERWDGLGYPSGLAGTGIHKLARILAVADTFDAMASPRPYRKALDPDSVLAIIVDGAGRHFDPDMVPPFVEIMRRRGVTVGTVPEAYHG